MGVEVGSYEQVPVIVLSNTTSQSTALKNPFQEIMGVSRFKPTTAEWGVYHCAMKHWVWLGYVRFPNFGSKGLLINTHSKPAFKSLTVGFLVLINEKAQFRLKKEKARARQRQ